MTNAPDCTQQTSGEYLLKRRRYLRSPALAIEAASHHVQHSGAPMKRHPIHPLMQLARTLLGCRRAAMPWQTCKHDTGLQVPNLVLLRSHSASDN